MQTARNIYVIEGEREASQLSPLRHIEALSVTKFDTSPALDNTYFIEPFVSLRSAFSWKHNPLGT
jgi:hypothetical protein